MAESALITPIGHDIVAEPAPETGKKQFPGESALWYRRYLLYRDLGHKRTLRAAVAKERETLRLVKEGETATKSPQTQKSETPINVPGSWKNACKQYRWHERAKAFDEYLLAGMAERTAAKLGDTYANKFKRVMLLEGLITGLTKALNGAVDKGVDHDIYLRYVKQIAALVRQMETEMAGFSEEEMRAAVLAHGRTFQDDIERAYHSGQTAIVRK